MNVYKNMSALKYIIMCVNNWGLFLSQKKENGVKKVSGISDGESMCCEKKLKRGAKKDAEKFGGKGKRQYLCNRKSETDRWS